MKPTFVGRASMPYNFKPLSLSGQFSRVSGKLLEDMVREACWTMYHVMYFMKGSFLSHKHIQGNFVKQQSSGPKIITALHL